ncbi:MAG: hypothetical protein JO041_00230 [Acidobacteria bacterium]|nr:hypothetical protein [Acidobacteriota bacterium]
MTRRSAIQLLTAAGAELFPPHLFAGRHLIARLQRLDPDRLLDDLERAACLFFWEQADASTGLVKDRALADGDDKRTIGSIAATGFGLAALCIAAQRGYRSRSEAEARAQVALRFLWESLPNEHGFFHHFVDIRTGERAFRSEVSSIDTAILLCGILTCGQYFSGAAAKLARQIYERADWQWMLDGGELLSHGWKPESGFLAHRWDSYCELMMLYLLAIGSPRHPIPPGSWDAWQRPIFHYYGYSYIGARAPLFVHQYSHAWFDFRKRRDRYADYFENSVIATRAHRRFCIDLHAEFPDYSEALWGITASDSARGYTVWGGPPRMGPIDGTVVPAAAAGSLPFLPECLDVLQNLRERFGDKVWRRYGFVDAFNPITEWADPDVIGIDLGISLLMAENYRTGSVWRWFMKNPEARAAMGRVGFEP